MNWKEFKKRSEQKFRYIEVENRWGFQIQPDSKWDLGLSESDIQKLEDLFGFEFPYAYKEMLSVINGLDRDMIAIDLDGTDEPEFGQEYYKYPDDFEKAEWLITEIRENKKHVDKVLIEQGYNPGDMVGFVPLYGHQGLAVFSDKSLNPVISIHQGDDVVLMAKSIIDYLNRKFYL